MNVAARLPMLVLAMLALVVGVLAGLARLGVGVPLGAAAQMGGHGALMIAAFLGTVISLERAVALASQPEAGAGARFWPYLAPLCAGLGGAALLAGAPLWLVQAAFIAAGSLLTLGSALILRRQPALYTATLTLGALSWLVGSIAWNGTSSLTAAVPWWMAFLVLTIAGERLELTRFLPAPAAAKPVFSLIVAAMLAGLGIAGAGDDVGLPLFAAALTALSLWLLRYDIARRTVRQSGLTRYIAACLLAGYAWLAVGGLLGTVGGLAPGNPLRDAALHAVLLGFVFSMIFGHAPIVFPAVARIRIAYHPGFYLQLAALHLSLLARVVGDLADMTALRQGAAVANAVALAIFVATMLSSALGARRTAAAS